MIVELTKLREFLNKRIETTTKEHKEFELAKDYPRCVAKGNKLTAYKEVLYQVNRLLQ